MVAILLFKDGNEVRCILLGMVHFCLINFLKVGGNYNFFLRQQCFSNCFCKLFHLTKE